LVSALEAAYVDAIAREMRDEPLLLAALSYLDGEPEAFPRQERLPDEAAREVATELARRLSAGDWSAYGEVSAGFFVLAADYEFEEFEANPAALR
jgi:hypothetical protein